MKTDLILDTEDRSYYADKLSKATGESRRAWRELPLLELKLLCRKLITRQFHNHREENTHGTFNR